MKKLFLILASLFLATVSFAATEKAYLDAAFTSRTGPTDSYSLLHQEVLDGAHDLDSIIQNGTGCTIYLGSDLEDWSAIDTLVANHTAEPPIVPPSVIIIPAFQWVANGDTVDEYALYWESLRAVHVSDAGLELFCSIVIPPGKKATLVDVYADTARAIEIWEIDATDGSITSKGTGTSGTQLNMTDVNASATTYLLLEYSAAATTDDVYSAIITIADI